MNHTCNCSPKDAKSEGFWIQNQFRGWAGEMDPLSVVLAAHLEELSPYTGQLIATCNYDPPSSSLHGSLHTSVQTHTFTWTNNLF